MTMSNYASSLGQKIGKTLENAVYRHLRHAIDNIDYNIRSEMLENGNDNKYSIDMVIRNHDGDIKALIEVKFIRYKKHNRDKGSWIANTHGVLKSHYKTITGCYAVLAGNWSEPSLEMMRRNGEVIILIEFDHVADVYLRHGVDLRWGKDDDKKRAAFDAENRLSNVQKEQIGDSIIKDILPELDKIMDAIT